MLLIIWKFLSMEDSNSSQMFRSIPKEMIITDGLFQLISRIFILLKGKKKNIPIKRCSDDYEEEEEKEISIGSRDKCDGCREDEDDDDVLQSNSKQHPASKIGKRENRSSHQTTMFAIVCYRTGE